LLAAHRLADPAGAVVAAARGFAVAAVRPAGAWLAWLLLPASLLH
jgi:hypothetical protein